MFPPHARGWTRTVACAWGLAAVSPARAGMDPRSTPTSWSACCFPRTRGDGPIVEAEIGTLSVFPPHARGWTLDFPSANRHRSVSPARAGMDRLRWRPSPRKVPFPPHARGWTLPSGRCRFPRTRGDGPQQQALSRFPPHARGWTLDEGRADADLEVSPARAGMDPSAVPWSRWRVPPHARGWTLRLGQQGGRAGVSPARAGMDPTSARRHFQTADGFPPHARGWT